MSLAYKLVVLVGILISCSCGIKGKPLPPLQQSVQSVSSSADKTLTK